MTWVIVLIMVAGVAGVALAISQSDSSETDVPQTAFAETLGTNLPPFTSPDPAIGLAAPVISAQTTEGTRTQLEADGTARVIGFFAHWCPVCQSEVPTVVDWLEANPLPANVEVVAISTGVDEGRGNYPPTEWFEAENWPAAVLLDSEDSDLALGFGLTAFPFWVAVDSDGNVVARLAGEIDDAAFGALVASVS
jgi:thiol-disulfide isomerase/thioredoxin